MFTHVTLMNLLLVGATGLVGSHVLQLALADARIHQVIVLTRRPLAQHPKLQTQLVDFDQLDADAPWWQADAVICALGTTMKNAGSRAAFRHVDYDYPMSVARLAQAHGTPVYVLNSAMGASATSSLFYQRVKGELERDLKGIGFASLTAVRPGLIGGKRAVVRPGEHIASLVLSVLAPVLPARWRINPAHKIAQALLDAAIVGKAGVHVIDSHTLV